MEKHKCLAPVGVIRAFLQSSDDNWRNSLYIDCSGCKYEKEPSCGDFLFVPASTGQPVLLPVHDAELIFSLIVDKSECLCRMSNLIFEELYRRYLTRDQPVPEGKCPLLYDIYHNMAFCAKSIQELSKNP